MFLIYFFNIASPKGVVCDSNIYSFIMFYKDKKTTVLNFIAKFCN